MVDFCYETHFGGLERVIRWDFDIDFVNAAYKSKLVRIPFYKEVPS